MLHDEVAAAILSMLFDGIPDKPPASWNIDPKSAIDKPKYYQDKVTRILSSHYGDGVREAASKEQRQRAKDLHSEVTAALSDMEGNREGEINLNSLQEEVAVWTHKNFDNQEPFEPLLGAVEELGELSHHWLKRFQGIRGSAEMHRKEEIDAVGDVVIYLMSFCDLNGYDFHNCVKRAWMEVRDRNWKANPDGEGYGNPNKEITAALSDKEGT